MKEIILRDGADLTELPIVEIPAPFSLTHPRAYGAILAIALLPPSPRRDELLRAYSQAKP